MDRITPDCELCRDVGGGSVIRSSQHGRPKEKPTGPAVGQVGGLWGEPATSGVYTRHRIRLDSSRGGAGSFYPRPGGAGGLIIILNEVFPREGKRWSKNQKLVATAIAVHMGGKVTAWPSVETISRMSGVCRDSVYKALGSLCGPGGLLKRRRRGRGMSNLYEVRPLMPSDSDTDDDSEERRLPILLPNQTGSRPKRRTRRSQVQELPNLIPGLVAELKHRLKGIT